MSEPTHYLRIEGANLAHFIEDTQDLSTVRGAGLLLLNAVDFAAATLGVTDEKTLSRGASAGVFEVTTDNPAGLRASLLAALAKHPQFKHVTFLADTTPVTPVTAAMTEFRGDVERLLAQNRARQLREPSLVVPEWNTNPAVRADDFFDRMRPAPKTMPVPDDSKVAKTKPAKTSRFTITRRKHGRKQRKLLYKSLGVATDSAFSDDFQTLGGGEGHGLCRDKIAIFYADGNKFGKIQRDHCGEPELLRTFDKNIRDKRAGLLKALIDSTEGDKRWWNKNPKDKDVRRLETLLWGGDELIWVVPAWLGWEVAAFFFAHTKDWSFTATAKDGTRISEELTHSAGLVFASVKAPIQRLKKLAQNLAQLAKDTIEDRGIEKRERNLLAYDVLESFDFPSGDIDANWKRRLGKSGLAPGDLLLPGTALADFQMHARNLAAADFPQRQLHEQVRAALQPGHEWKDSDAKEFEALKSVAALLEPAKKKAAWVHLAQLWNYTARTPAKS